VTAAAAAAAGATIASRAEAESLAASHEQARDGITSSQVDVGGRAASGGVAGGEITGEIGGVAGGVARALLSEITKPDSSGSA